MARLLADENFPAETVALLRVRGHDVVTVHELGLSGRGWPDKHLLVFATANNRAVLTFDRRDYRNLHRRRLWHGGIIACTFNSDSCGLAERIHEAIRDERLLLGRYINVYKPHR